MNFKESKGIYLQIADRICDEVLLGIYNEDDRIPSVREYAALVEVNVNTMVRSYEYLQQQGARKQILSMRRAYFMDEEADYFFKQLYLLDITPDEVSQMYREYINKQKQ